MKALPRGPLSPLLCHLCSGVQAQGLGGWAPGRTGLHGLGLLGPGLPPPRDLSFGVQPGPLHAHLHRASRIIFFFLTLLLPKAWTRRPAPLRPFHLRILSKLTPLLIPSHPFPWQPIPRDQRQGWGECRLLEGQGVPPPENSEAPKQEGLGCRGWLGGGGLSLLTGQGQPGRWWD